MRTVLRHVATASVALGAVGLALACGSPDLGGSGFGGGSGKGGDGSSGGDGTSGGFGSSGGDGDAAPACTGLQCQQGGDTTTVSGTVFAPEGTIPLYNAIVYVPNSKPDGFVDGVTCDQCGKVSGNPITTTLTDESGIFHLKNVPVGTNIPLVIQIGKWRRQVTIPSVTKGTDTKVAADLTRMPRSQAEGDMPKIAIATGGADSLECFLRKVGIADSEFTNASGTGRVHFYTGNGSKLAGGNGAGTDLWSQSATLKKYDITILSCEGSENTGNKQAFYPQVLDYLNAGGRVFASHFHYVWFRYGPAPLPTTADWANADDTDGPYAIDSDFPKGKAFGDWLVNTGATTVSTSIDLTEVKDSSGNSNPAVSRRWIHSNNPETGKYFSFNTPIGEAAEKQCGRGVFTDVHVSGTGSSNGTFPGFCGGGALSPNEKALLFLFFDLASCVQDESKPPEPPPVK